MDRILITGGTGTVGETLITHYMRDNIVICYSRDEYKQAKLEEKLNNKNIRYFLGDIRDERRLSMAMRGCKYVIHAAALKRIEACERDPIEAVKTNINGTISVIHAAIDNKIKKAILISTDKAVNPIGLYGYSKAAAETIWQKSNCYSQIFTVVRFGNIINSRGSVLDKFLAIKSAGGKVVPLTALAMRRYWYDAEDIIQLVSAALTGDNGIYIKNKKKFYVKDLISALNLEYKIIGTDGEKYDEEMLTEEEKKRVTIKKIPKTGTEETKNIICAEKTMSEREIKKCLEKLF